MTTRNRSFKKAGRFAAVAVSVATALPALGGVAGAQLAPIILDPQCPVSAPPAPIADRDEVPAVHRTNVDCSFALGIARGTGEQPNRYRPAAGTRRDQMASLIVRTLQAAGYQLPAPQDQGFRDIAGNTHRDVINQLAAIGVVKGKSATTYDPAGLVKRDQMASFIVRTAEHAYGTELEATERTVFIDVTPNNVHAGNIETAYQVLGLTQGTTRTRYYPGQITNRAQMATFMIRLVSITLNT